MFLWTDWDNIFWGGGPSGISFCPWGIKHKHVNIRWCTQFIYSSSRRHYGKNRSLIIAWWTPRTGRHAHSPLIHNWTIRHTCCWWKIESTWSYFFSPFRHIQPPELRHILLLLYFSSSHFFLEIPADGEEQSELGTWSVLSSNTSLIEARRLCLISPPDVSSPVWAPSGENAHRKTGVWLSSSESRSRCSCSSSQHNWGAFLCHIRS